MSFLISPFPPGALQIDPNWSSVVLMCGFETSIADESAIARTLTAVGNAGRTTGQSKYGVASVVMDGTGDRVTAPQSNDFAFGNGDYTIEGWFRLLVKNNTQALISQWQVSGVVGQSAWAFWIQGGNLGIRIAVVGSTIDYQAAWVPTLGQWYHLCACRSVASTKIFVDGTAISTTTGAPATINSGVGGGAIFALGSVGGGFATFDYNGNMDEVRVTKGVARYTANFTPPIAAFPRG